MRKTTVFMLALSEVFLSLAGNPSVFAAHTLRDLSLAESAPKRAGMEEALDPPDEEALLESVGGNWHARVKQGKAVNPDALWVALGGKPPEHSDRVDLINALHEAPGDVFVVPDNLLSGRATFRGELGLYIGEGAARQAGIAKLLPALKSGDFSSLPVVKELDKVSSGSASRGIPTAATSPFPGRKPSSDPSPEPKKTRDSWATAAEVLTPDKLRDQLRRWVPELLRRPGILPNSVLHNQATGWMGVDTSSFPGPSFFFIRVPLGNFYLRVLLPDPGLNGLPSRYAVELNAETAIARAKERNPAFKEFYRQHSSLSRLSRFFPHPKHTGQNLLGKALAVIDQNGLDKAPNEEEPGLALLRKTVRRILRLSALIERADARVAGKEQTPLVSGAIVREALAPLPSALADWPYLQAYARLYRDGILPESEVELEEVRGHLSIIGTALMEAIHAEMGEHSGLLQRSYHRLTRRALREEILRLQEELDRVMDPQVPEELAAEITTAATMILAAEMEEKLYRMALEGAKRGGSVSPHDLSGRLNAAGALFMNAAGEPERFIPGAGAVAETRWRVGHLQVHPLKDWGRDLPVVALVVPTFSGVPNPDQIQWFLSDAALVHRSFGWPVEVYLAAAREDGSVTLYKPSFPTADPQAWAAAMVKMTRTDSFDRFSNALAGRLDTSSKATSKLAATEMAKTTERTRVIGLILQLAKDLKGVVRQEIRRVSDDRYTAWVMEAVEAALGRELAALSGTQFGQPQTRTWAAKIWDTNHEIQGLCTVLSAAAGERMAFSLMNELFVPVSLPWTAPAAPSPSPVEESFSGAQDKTREKIPELVRRALDKKLIRPDQEQELADFIEKVWLPSHPAAVNYPRLEEAWKAHGAEQDRLRRQKELDAAAAAASALELERQRQAREAEKKLRDAQRLAKDAVEQRAERAGKVPDLVARLHAVNVGNLEKVRGILQESGALFQQIDPAQEAVPHAQLRTARISLGVRFAKGRLSSAEQALPVAVRRPDSDSLNLLARAGERLEEALKVVGDLEPARQSLEQALAGIHQAAADVQQAIADAQRKTVEKVQPDQVEVKQKQPKKTRQVELTPLQQAAAAILTDAGWAKLLTPRSGELLKEIRSRGWTGKLDKVQSLLADSAETRLKNTKVLGDPLQFSFYKALLEVARLHEAAAPEDSRAGAEEEARQRAGATLKRLAEETPSPAVEVLGPSVHRSEEWILVDRLLEQLNFPLRVQIFLDPVLTHERINQWVNQFFSRQKRLPDRGFYFGEREEFRNFKLFSDEVIKVSIFPITVHWAARPRDPIQLAFKILKTIGLPLDRLPLEEFRQLERDLHLLVQA